MAEVSRRISELLSYMDTIRQQLVGTASDMNPAFASVRPRSGAWSPAENLAHLAIVEEGVARLIEKSLQWARTHGVGPPTSDESVVSSFDEFYVIDARTKLVAPEMVMPPQDRPIGESLASLERSRARLREALVGASDLDLSVVKRPHRVFGEINLYQWALFVAQHEERHRRQIERTLREVTGLAAECAPIV